MFEGFVLAGGKSTRMGREKALLELDKRPLLEIAVDTLRSSGAEKVTVLSGDKGASLRKQFPQLNIVDDFSPGLGAPGGIYSALESTHCDEFFILGCDFPFVTVDLVQFLLRRLRRGEYDAVVPVQPDGFKQTLVAAYRKSKCIVPFQAEILRGDSTPSVRQMLENVSANYVDFEEIASMENAGNLFININTPDDLSDAREMLRDE